MTIVILVIMATVMIMQIRRCRAGSSNWRYFMARKTLFPSILATALAASAAASAYTDPASKNPAQTWIARIETRDLLPAQPGATTVRINRARDFLARFDTPAFSPARPGKAGADNHPDRDFIARLSTGDSSIAAEIAAPPQPGTASYSVAARAGR
jgi:hypothetical protein